MIARTWRGWTVKADADRYADYVRRTGIDELCSTPGNCGAYLLTRTEGDLTEFLVMSLWASIDHIKAFAGDDVGRAVFYPDDAKFLVDREERVSHFTVAAAGSPEAPRPEDCWHPNWL
jgi:heme-degrading monooxygenase HmoA